MGNRKVSDAQLAAAAEALRRSGARLTGRALRALLRREHGVSGKTERLYAACRQAGTAASIGSAPVEQLKRELLEAHQSRALALAMRDQAVARAERAEARELAHQDRWATEIHTLRESVAQLKGERSRRQVLEEQLVRLQREVQVLRRRLAGTDE